MFKSYLAGTRREKEKINVLLTRNQPMFDSYDYQYLCNTLVEKLIDNKCRNLKDFDDLLCDYLDELETDVIETLMKNNVADAFMPYLLDVEAAFQYFRNYLDVLDMFPLPKSLKVFSGPGNTVLRLRIEL